MKRVAFAGASGTGKTKLVEYLATKYYLPMCPVGSRSVAKEMGFESPYDVDVAGKRIEFQTKLFHKKARWELDHASFITDRTTFDNLTYMSMHNAAQTLTEHELEEYVLAMQRYTHIFYLPVRRFQNLGSDVQRVQSRAYHEIYDVLLIGLLCRFDIPHTALNCHVDRRMAIVEGVLGKS